MTTFEDETLSPFAPEAFELEAPRGGSYQPTPTGRESASITIDTVVQGKLAGDNGVAGGRIATSRVSYSVTAPRDLATGAARGARRHQPLLFQCVLGPHTPQLFSALVRNEVVKTLTVEFYRAAPTGQQVPHVTITLKNALVGGVQLIQANGQLTLVEVSVTFQTIEITTRDGKNAADSWPANV